MKGKSLARLADEVALALQVMEVRPKEGCPVSKKELRAIKAGIQLALGYVTLVAGGDVEPEEDVRMEAAMLLEAAVGTYAERMRKDG